MGVFGLIGDLISATTNYNSTLATNSANRDMQIETNRLNKQIADEANALQLNMFNEQMDYTRQLQETEWNRADTQLQRAVADAELAGLSPLTVFASTANICKSNFFIMCPPKN